MKFTTDVSFCKHLQKSFTEFIQTKIITNYIYSPARAPIGVRHVGGYVTHVNRPRVQYIYNVQFHSHTSTFILVQFSVQI